MQTIDQTIERTAEAAEAAAQQALATARGFAVQSDAEYASASDELKAIKGRQRDLDEQEKAITRPLNDSLKRVRDLFRAPKDFLAEAERTIKRAMLTYQDECERRRREEQRRAEEAAAKERQRLERQAAKAAEKGQEQKAEALVERAATVTAPVIHREAPKVVGVATRENWKAEVTDLEALVKAVAAGQAPIALLQANTTEIGKRVRALKSEFQYPGIHTWSEKVMAAS